MCGTRSAVGEMALANQESTQQLNNQLKPTNVISGLGDMLEKQRNYSPTALSPNNNIYETEQQWKHNR